MVDTYYSNGNVTAKTNALIDHPTPKDIGMVTWLVRSTSRMTILDPFLGSGTTAVACARLGRKCIGIEIEEKYCRIAADRCDRELDQLKLALEVA
jgi:DNA modification methylase